MSQHNKRAKKNSYVWAFDSEFLQSGRSNRPEDITSIQFSNGIDSYVIENSTDLKHWLHNHEHIKTLYAFVALPDLASIEGWLGEKQVSYKMRGGQLVGQVKYRGFNCMVYDARPILQNFGLFRLEQCGKVVGVPKLQKPDWLGLRNWQNEQEHKQFIDYAAQDAIITSKIVQWLITKFDADPAIYASAGTLAKDEFELPKRLERVKKTVILSPLELAVKNACYAGRNECFVNGFSSNVYYNDVKSLYPCSVVATRALQITGCKPCSKDEVVIGDMQRFGWLEGVFETNNDAWGLPLRGKNNFYVTGVIQGFYHSFDLAAANAKVHHIVRVYKPVFSNENKQTHDKYANMLLRRLENASMTADEKLLAKAVLNSLTGKLGQSKPALAVTSNFFAYSTILAFSHVIMSRLFASCQTPILGTDTDSIFTQTNLAGKRFELTDGEYKIPVILDVKGIGDLVYFRAKNYILKRQDEDKPTVYGRHGWVYFLEDYLKMFDGTITELLTRQDIKHTLLTRQKEAQRLQKGRWFTKPVKLDLEKLKQLLKADLKRNRQTYDSYGLVMQHKSQTSKAWSFDEIMQSKENKLGYPSG